MTAVAVLRRPARGRRDRARRSRRRCRPPKLPTCTRRCSATPSSSVDRSGGELLVNPVNDDLPAEYRTDAAPRPSFEPSSPTPSAAPRRSGSSGRSDRRSARAGKHRYRPARRTPRSRSSPRRRRCSRTVIDSAAMKLRTNEVVLGPSTRGRTYYAGFTAPIDLRRRLRPPNLPTLAARATPTST